MALPSVHHNSPDSKVFAWYIPYPLNLGGLPRAAAWLCALDMSCHLRWPSALWRRPTEVSIWCVRYLETARSLIGLGCCCSRTPRMHALPCGWWPCSRPQQASCVKRDSTWLLKLALPTSCCCWIVSCATSSFGSNANAAIASASLSACTPAQVITVLVQQLYQPESTGSTST